MAEDEQQATSSEGIVSPKQTVPKVETAKKRRPQKKQPKKAAKKAAPVPEISKGRAVRNFPASTFQEALVLPEAFQKFAAGQAKVRKLTLFDKMGKSPDSGPSRQLITNSSRYSLTKGGYQADFLELTPEGTLATADDVPVPKKLQTRFDLAIKNIQPFNLLYERCKGQKLPSKEFLIDVLRESDPDEASLQECVDTFILNATFLGLLRTIAGSERLITIEHALEEVGKSAGVSVALGTEPEVVDTASSSATSLDGFDSICFYITPIGADNSEQRKHQTFSWSS